MIVWPQRGTTFEEWSASLRLLRSDIEIQPLNPKEKDWQQYARSVIQSQICQTLQVPRPDGYKNWQSWVEDMIRCFGSSA